MSQSKIHVAIVGVGLVGSELINQILSIPQHSSPFSLISLSSSTRTLFNKSSPIQPGANWKSALAASPNKSDLGALTQQLKELVAKNQRVAIVDNTSSDQVAAFYPEWLRQGFHVVTPNKKAFSGELSLYEDILKATKESGARFLNESTVGAGLPVINTLKELVASGDKVCHPICVSLSKANVLPQVIKIEGVFSGTMSYIFNEFSTGKSEGPNFSSVVSIAREKGYTVRTLPSLPNISHPHLFIQEPHPADDLNGFDVARKLTILSRTITTFSNTPTSLPQLQSFKSVQTTSLIPPALEVIPTGDEFISRLPEFDAEFAKLRTEASAEGKVLRFVGVVDAENGQVKAGLEKYVRFSPFLFAMDV